MNKNQGKLEGTKMNESSVFFCTLVIIRLKMVNFPNLFFEKKYVFKLGFCPIAMVRKVC